MIGSETALSFFAGKPRSHRFGVAPIASVRHKTFHRFGAVLIAGPTQNLWERGLPAKASGQAALILRLSTVVQRSDKITPPNVNTPPTR